jgi:hypothetical protein
MSDGFQGGRRRFAAGVSAGVEALRGRVAPVRGGELGALRRRVAELESEIQECRRLNIRLAELTDVVQELLVPLAQRDEAKVREYLDRYASGL